MDYHNDPKTKLLRTLSVVTAVVAAALLLTIVLRTAILCGTTTNMLRDETMEPFAQKWTLTTVEGTVEVTLPYTVETKGTVFTLSTTIDPAQIDPLITTMAMHLERVGLRVTVGDHVLYEANNTALFKGMDSNGEVIFSLPDTTEAYTLEFSFSHIKGSYEISEIMAGSHYAITSHTIRNAILQIVMIDVMAVIGLCLLALVIFFSFRKMRDVRLSSLSSLILTLAIWAFVDSDIPQLWGLSLELGAVLSNMSLALLPISINYFMWETCGRYHKTYRVFVIVTWCNVIMQTTLSLLGIASLHTMLLITHAVLGMNVLLSLIVCVREYKKGQNKVILKHAMFSQIILIVAFVVVAVMYWLGEGELYRIVFLSAMAAVVIVLLAIIFVDYLEKNQRNKLQKAELAMYEDLALKDGMTDLGNRRAFEVRMKEFDDEPRKNPDAIMLILDLNGLKKLNDDYGHTAGDEAIVVVANAIKNCYGMYGECFRIGGDEFAIMVTDLSVDIRALNKRFDAALSKYNETAQLRISVAKGSSDLYDHMSRRLTTTEWKQAADIAMYADKQLYATGRSISRAEDLQSILDCVISMVEAKDQYTAKHSERVREMSVAIARWMNLSPDTIEQIDMASHLHDIGKVGIPEAILLKPSRLTDEEFTIMKTHPTIGAQVIERAKGMSEIAAIVLHHHERYDGKGYPEGIGKEDIPIGARIVAVADSIDAMTSRRCYRDSLGLDVCRDEIERNLGKMYDPAIGSIALEHWNDISEMVQRG